MTIPELIEALEKSSGPDRELDCHIAIALDIWPTWRSPSSNEEAYVKTSTLGPEVAVRIRGRRKSRGNTPIWYTHEVYEEHRLPRYTASIDAAIALVERKFPGKGALIDTASNRAGIGRSGEYPSSGATPAIALCRALLRALHKEEP